MVAAKASLFPRIGVRAGGSLASGGVTVAPEIGGVIPILGGRRFAVENAQAEFQAASSRLALAQRDVKVNDQTLRIKLNALVEGIREREEVLESNRELTRLRRAEYEIGGGDIADIISSLRNEFTARNSLLQSRTDLMSTLTKILINTGEFQSLFVARDKVE